MRRHRFLRRLVGPALLLAAGPGCQTTHPPGAVTVVATDAETKRPIPGAEVRFAVPGAHGVTPVTTGADGAARLPAALHGDDGVTVEVSAAGYSFEEKYFSATALAGPQAPGAAVELYADPRPTVELVVPAGFRGVLQVQLLPRDDAPGVPGQRWFSFPVSADGPTRIAVPPLFRHFGAPEFRARFADGTLLSGQAQGAEIGFWWLKSEGGDFFLVGTREEYNDLRRSEPKVGAAPPAHPGGKGGGRGGRRGGGGGNPAPAGPN